MKRIFKVFCLFVALSLTACASLNQSAQSPALNVKVTSEMSADIQVGAKTSGSSHTTVILGFIKLGDNKFADGVNFFSEEGKGFSLGFASAADDAKSAAAYKAIQSANADILVAPKYVVQEFNFLGIYKTYDADVTGFAGNIKSVKQK